jgi:hypothetical protein
MSSVTFSTSESKNVNETQKNTQSCDLPLRDSILRVPSSLCQLLKLSSPLMRGLYSHPLVRSGSHLAEAAAVEPFLSQPYW